MYYYEDSNGKLQSLSYVKGKVADHDENWRKIAAALNEQHNAEVEWDADDGCIVYDGEYLNTGVVEVPELPEVNEDGMGPG